MTSTESRTNTRPGEVEIRSELLAIRKAKGLDVVSVRAHGIKLQQLPVVDDEMGRSNYEESNRVVATVKAVRCAVEELANRNDRQSFEILLRTLINRDRAQTLDAIRTELITQLYLSDRSRQYYDDIESKAYVRLAGTLVEADASPCRSKDMQAAVDELVEIYCRSDIAIREVLAAYGYSIDDPILQSALRRALIEKLPRGVSALRAHAVPEELLPDALLIVGFYHHRAELLRFGLSADYFYWEFIRPRAETTLQSQLGRIAGVRQHKTNPGALARDRAHPDLRNLRYNFIRALAGLVTLEEERDWPSIRRS